MEGRPLRILVVDDEKDLVWALQYSLSDEGYEVFGAYDGVQALALARRHRPDLVVLDITMRGMDGLETCRSLRRDPALGAVPILFLTVRSDVKDRVTALNQGGDDYIVKPFDLRELKARIGALLRRSRGRAGNGLGLQDQGSLVIGPLTLDLHRRQVRVGEKISLLTPVEFDLLHYLMVHYGEVFSTEQLLQGVWNFAPGAGGHSVVRWHIKNLRRKIEPDPAHPVYIRTVARHGYMLLCEE
ncbi:MAG: response regulator transcription factor [Chloroflexi bacterium]|nr:response regulator transcription factor [Chloroflexota bacterium]